MCIHLLCLLLEFTEITERWQSTQRRTNSPDCWPAPLTTLFVGQLRGRVQRVKRSQEGTCTRMWCPEALRSVLMPSTVIQMIDPSIGQCVCVCACVCKVSYESPMMAMAWNISYMYMYSLYSILVNKYPHCRKTMVFPTQHLSRGAWTPWDLLPWIGWTSSNLARPKWPKARFFSTEELAWHTCNQTLMLIRRDAISTLGKASRTWKLEKQQENGRLVWIGQKWMISQGLVYRWPNVRVQTKWIPNYPSSINCILFHSGLGGLHSFGSYGHRVFDTLEVLGGVRPMKYFHRDGMGMFAFPRYWQVKPFVLLRALSPPPTSALSKYGIYIEHRDFSGAADLWSQRRYVATPSAIPGWFALVSKIGMFISTISIAVL